MYDNTQMVFNIKKVQTLEVRFRHNFSVAKSTLLDFTHIPGRVEFKSIAPENEFEMTMVNLGRTLFAHHLVINTNSLLIHGETYDPRQRLIKSGKMSGTLDENLRIELYANEIQFQDGAFLEAAKIFIFAHKAIDIYGGVRMESTIENECHIAPTVLNPDSQLFKCMDPFDKKMLKSTLNLETMLKLYND